MPSGIKNITTSKTGKAVLKNASVDGKALLASVTRKAKEQQVAKKKAKSTGSTNKKAKDLTPPLPPPKKPMKRNSENNDGNEKKYDVFICHTESDKPKVKKIIRDFKANGVKYWVDHERVLFGGSIINAIEDGLNNSRYILVVLSKNFKDSNWCRKEYEPILHKEYNRKENRVIPLTLDGCTDDDIPSMLYGKKHVNYANKKDFKEFLLFLKQ